MKKIVSFLTCLLAVNLLVRTRALAFDDAAFQVDITYDLSTVSPAAFNTARETVLWNSSTPSDGDFNQLTGFSAGLGYRFFESGSLGLQYVSGSQTLPQTDITGTPSWVQDSFHYQAVYLTYDHSLLEGEWILEIGGGLGSATKFEYHQQVGGGGSWHETLVWKGSAIPMKVRATVGYSLTEMFQVLFRVQYEQVASKLKLASSTTQISPAIEGGTEFPATGDTASADMSGLRLSLGLGLRF